MASLDRVVRTMIRMSSSVPIPSLVRCGTVKGKGRGDESNRRIGVDEYEGLWTRRRGLPEYTPSGSHDWRHTIETSLSRKCTLPLASSCQDYRQILALVSAIGRRANGIRASGLPPCTAGSPLFVVVRHDMWEKSPLSFSHGMPSTSFTRCTIHRKENRFPINVSTQSTAVNVRALRQ